MMAIIREIRKEEINSLVELCEAHAAYEKAAYFDKEERSVRLAHHLFKDSPSLYCFVAVVNDEMVGYTSYSLEFSTWEAGYYVHMDCLFVTDRYRGNKIGEQLVNKIKEESKLKGIRQIQWQTPDDNVHAIRFYDRIGGVKKKKYRYSLVL